MLRLGLREVNKKTSLKSKWQTFKDEGSLREHTLSNVPFHVDVFFLLFVYLWLFSTQSVAS